QPPLLPDLGQGLVDVGDDVVDVFEADGDPHQARGDADGFELVVGHLAVGGGRGVQDAGARVGDVDLARDEFEGVHELHAGIAAALEVDGQYARCPLQVLLREVVVRRGRQAGVADVGQ